jgi:hypothetical protein
MAALSGLGKVGPRSGRKYLPPWPRHHPPPGLTEGVQAGTWRREFAERGVTLHQADCLIAAAAAGVDASLATANVDDFPMYEVALEHWPSIS